MNPDSSFRPFPGLNGNHGAGSLFPPPPPPPRTAVTFMNGNILITALVAVIVIIFFVTCYRLYVFVFWHRRHREIPTSWLQNQAESPPLAGLDKAIVDSLPAFTYKLPPDGAGNTGLSECAVCLIEFQDDDICRLLPKCRHIFHSECIDKWFLFHTTCPMCRMHPEMMQAEKAYQEDQNARAWLLPQETTDEQIQASELRTCSQENCNQMRRLRSQSSAFLPLHEGISNDHILRTRSDSLFGLEREREGLGLHLRQVFARTFSAGTYGNYDIVGEETSLDVNTANGDMFPDIERIGDGDSSERHPGSHSQKLHVECLPLPNWHRSASDKCLHMRQGLQLTTSVLSQGSSLSRLPHSLHPYHHFQIEGTSVPPLSMDLPKLQDGGFLFRSVSSSPLHRHSISEQQSPIALSHLEHNKLCQSADSSQSPQVGRT